jgi:hypothetical protein
LRKQTILQIVTSPEGAVSERHPTLILRQKISDMYTTDR